VTLLTINSVDKQEEHSRKQMQQNLVSHYDHLTDLLELNETSPKLLFLNLDWVMSFTVYFKSDLAKLLRCLRLAATSSVLEASSIIDWASA